MHDDNVMVLKQYDDEDNENDFFKYCNVGHGLEPVRMEFIDFGTSQWRKTTFSKGIKRDFKKIFENTKKILSFSYNIEEFINLKSLSRKSYGGYKFLKVQILIVELIRIIVSLYYLEMIIFFERTEIEKNKYDELLDIITKVWNYDFANEVDFKNSCFENLKYWKEIKKPSTGNFINYQNIVKSINKKLIKSQLYYCNGEIKFLNQDT